MSYRTSVGGPGGRNGVQLWALIIITEAEAPFRAEKTAFFIHYKEALGLFSVFFPKYIIVIYNTI